MKKLVLFIMVAGFTMSGCVKDRDTPTIIGSWQISNITGTYLTRSSQYAATTTTTYSYSAPTLTELTSDSISENMLKINVRAEDWEFNTDGTFAIFENFEPDTSTIPVINNISGWWDYTSSSVPDNCVILRSYTTPVLLPMGGTFLITQVTGDQLILNVNESSSLSTGATTIRNITMTFSKVQ